jgi:hypothetical protein
MDCQIEWRHSKVEHGKLSVRLEPSPDFAFMMEFDRIVDPVSAPAREGWGTVLLAHGNVVVSDVRIEFAQELRTYLDEAVQEANRRAVDTRAREEAEQRARAAHEAELEAQRSAVAQAAAERDAQLTDAFRRSD